MKHREKLKEIKALFLEIEQKSTHLNEIFSADTTNRNFVYSSEVMQKLGISESTLKRMRRRQEIPFFKLSGVYIYPKAYFDNLLERRFRNKFKHLYPEEE